jgi:enoyl-CoA hydratase
MQTEMAPVGEPGFCLALDRHAGFDWTDLETVLALPEREPQLALIARRSPTSLAVIHASQLAARHIPDIAGVLALDLRLAGLMVRRPDFTEGVRAVLVDKDQNAAWRPASLAGVDRAAISAAIAGG